MFSTQRSTWIVAIGTLAMGALFATAQTRPLGKALVPANGGNPRAPRTDATEVVTPTLSTGLTWVYEGTLREVSAAPTPSPTENPSPAPERFVGTTRFLLQCLSYTSVPDPRTAHIERHDVAAIVETTPPDASDAVPEQRLVFWHFDREQRLQSVYGYWEQPAFDALQLAIVPPILASGSTTGPSQFTGLGQQFAIEQRYDVSHDAAEIRVHGELVAATKSTASKSTLRSKTDDYRFRPDVPIPASVVSHWTIRDGSGDERVFELELALTSASAIDAELHFQRRAELGTIESNLRDIHPALDIDAQLHRAARFKERLLGSPYADVCYEAMVDRIESIRPERARYASEQKALEKRWLDNKLAFDGLPTIDSDVLLVIFSESTDDKLFGEIERMFAKTTALRFHIVTTAKHPAAISLPRSTVQKNGASQLRQVGVSILPSLFVVDRAGTVRSIQVGYASQVIALLHSKLRPLLLKPNRRKRATGG